MLRYLSLTLTNVFCLCLIVRQKKRMGYIIAQLAGLCFVYLSCMMKYILFSILISSVFGSLSWAKVDISATQRMSLPEVQEASIISKEAADRIRPKNVTGNEGSAVFNKMADNTLSYWWETTPLRQSKLGQAAEAVEKKARFQGKIEGGDNKVTHTFDLKVLLMQALARFEYKGWVRAGVNYDARAAATEAEIIQPLTEGKDLVMSQRFNASESTSKVSFQFDW